MRPLPGKEDPQVAGVGGECVEGGVEKVEEVDAAEDPSLRITADRIVTIKLINVGLLY